jgi:hypothetical protein
MRDISESTAISFACCCKTFEEPVLSLLWACKPLEVLVKLLPSASTHTPEHTSFRPVRGEWKRFQRYASWIRVLFVNVTGEDLAQELLPLLDSLLNTSSLVQPTQHATRTILPNVCVLMWASHLSFLRYLPLFVSPTLIGFCIRIASCWGAKFTPDDYAPLTHTITSVLLPSTLQSFSLHISSAANPSPELKQAAAELILRCGPPLARLEVEFELPESAILHLMSLPNLTSWGAGQPAPTALISSPLRPTVAFSKVTHFTLETTAPRDWLSFLGHLVGGKSNSSSPTPSARNALYAPAFSNLTHLDMDTSRRHGCFGSCAFLLADSDLSFLADTFPHLEWLYLGLPCGYNTCQTTFRSLYTLSTQCLRLQQVCVHLNTTTLIQDILSVFEEQKRQSEVDGHNSKRNLRKRRRHPLHLRFVRYLPLELIVDVGDLEVISKGLFDIFVVFGDVPDLDPNCRFWTKVSQGIKTLQASERFSV